MDEPLDEVNQCAGRIALLAITVEASAQALRAHVIFAQRGKRDDPDVASRRNTSQDARGGETVVLRHADVQDDHVRNPPVDRVECVDAAQRIAGVEAIGGERGGESFGARFVVVHDENAPTLQIDVDTSIRPEDARRLKD